MGAITPEQVERDIRSHDMFNILFALPIQCVFTTLSLACGVHLPGCAWWILYILMDTCWVALKPHCVKSVRMIVFHHVIGLYLGIHVTTYVSHRQFCAYLTVIEFNTIFLIGRRYVQHWLWDLGFYASWFAIRTVWVPLMTARVILTVDDWPPGPWGAALMLSIYVPFVAMSAIQLNWTFQLLRRLLVGHKEQVSAKANGSSHKSHFL